MAIKIRLPYNTTSGAIPTATNLVLGELAVNTADGKLFTKNSGGSTVQINTTGLQGPQGASGTLGSPGTQGSQGVAGPQGFAGNTGATGPTGFTGAPGPTGSTGSQGPQGVAGPTGAPGPAGAQGPQGSQGPTGSPGPQGPQGPTGYTGSPSDYRIKSNTVSLVNSLDRVLTLNPVKFSFNSEPSVVVDGFIAHEVQEVIPEAVTGNKDGPEIQTLDQTKIIPIIVGAIQELHQLIDEMKHGN